MSAPNLLRVGTPQNIFVECQDCTEDNDIRVEIIIVNYPTKSKRLTSTSVTLTSANKFQAFGQIKVMYIYSIYVAVNVRKRFPTDWYICTIPGKSVQQTRKCGQKSICLLFLGYYSLPSLVGLIGCRRMERILIDCSLPFHCSTLYSTGSNNTFPTMPGSLFCTFALSYFTYHLLLLYIYLYVWLCMHVFYPVHRALCRDFFLLDFFGYCDRTNCPSKTNKVVSMLISFCIHIEPTDFPGNVRIYWSVGKCIHFVTCFSTFTIQYWFRCQNR